MHRGHLDLGFGTVIMRLIGALARAFLVVLLIATPSLLLPTSGDDVTQMVALVSIFGAALTIFEYASRYPGLVEFRDAPPFNRIRFFALFTMVFLISMVVRGRTDPTTTTQFIEAVGALIAHAIDFPYSPVRLVVLMLPANTEPHHVSLVRTAAGISYLTSLISLAVFLIALRLRHWPVRLGAFNVWVNLPTFDPTAVGDVVQRLERDARFNIALGFLLPFLTPAVVKAAATVFGAVTLENPHTLIWTVSAWAFLPASLFMRGIAMGRIAEMIAKKRRRRSMEITNDMLAA
jgi:hypothetical protein